MPTPLPNIGKSGLDPKNDSKSVTIEGKKVAIRGATFGAMGTGGGIVSANAEGPTSFVGPGSMNVKIEGKNVPLLGDPMLNNCGPSGSPANAATLMRLIQVSGWRLTAVLGEKVKPRSFGHRESVPPVRVLQPHPPIDALRQRQEPGEEMPAQEPEVETAMEAFILRVAPELGQQWKGATPDAIARIEQIAGRSLPPFYRWFLNRMGKSMRALAYPTLDFSAQRVLDCYAKGWVEPHPRLLLIAHDSHGMMPRPH